MLTGPIAKLSKYRVVTRLGSGGMAEVYLVLAERPGGFSKLQVLKLMRSDLTDQERPEFLQMFQDEARLAARLNHPNIVQSFEIGAEEGQPYIVMEFLEGQSLHRVQQRARHAGSGFPLELELFVLCQVLEGLEYAHGLTDYAGNRLDIVHRDVSPQNVFITYSGQSKLVDFGVAKTLESSKTRAGVVKGKVAYMAPEQVMSHPIDQRADLFSVGVLLWEAIARQPMHSDLTVYESMSRRVRGELPKVSSVVPNVDPALERIVERALALKPSDRYQDAESFRAELFAYLDRTSKVTARDVGNEVARLFAREREQLQETIRGASAGNTPVSEVHAPASVRVITRRIPEDDPSTDPTEAAPVHTPVHREGAMPAAAPPPDAAKTARVRLLGALSLVVAIAAALLFLQREPEESALEPATDRPPPAAAVPVPEERATEEPEVAPEPVAPARVRVAIEVEPNDAKVTLDGQELASNPYRADLPRDPDEHVLEASAPGHAPVRRTIRLDADLELALKLEKQAEAAPPPPVKAEPRPASTPRRVTKPQPRATGPTADDPYVDLPAPKRTKRPVPELDRNDPWQSDPAR